MVAYSLVPLSGNILSLGWAAAAATAVTSVGRLSHVLLVGASDAQCEAVRAALALRGHPQSTWIPGGAPLHLSRTPHLQIGRLSSAVPVRASADAVAAAMVFPRCDTPCAVLTETLFGPLRPACVVVLVPPLTPPFTVHLPAPAGVVWQQEIPLSPVSPSDFLVGDLGTPPSPASLDWGGCTASPPPAPPPHAVLCESDDDFDW